MDSRRKNLRIPGKQENCLTTRLRRMVRGVVKQQKWEESHVSTYLPPEQISLPVKWIWFAVLTTCLVLFVYQTYDRIVYYFTYPVTVDVLITKKIFQTFPDLTICSQETNDVMKLKTKLNLLRFCEFYSVISLFSKPRNVTMEEIWQHVNTTTTVESAKAFNMTDSNPLSYYEVPLVIGLCTIFHTSSQKPLHTHRGRFVIVQNLPKMECPQRSSSWVYITEPGEFTFTRKREIMTAGQVLTIAVTITQVEFVNRTHNICLSAEEYTKCIEDCYVEFSIRKLKCRFPFHPKRVNLPPCSPSPATHKEWGQMMSYWKAEDKREQCVCVRKCSHRVFDSQVLVTDASVNQTQVVVHIDDPHEILIKERVLYTFIQLLCDIGGNSGLCIGFSVLTLFEFGHAAFQTRKKRPKFDRNKDPLLRLVLRTFKEHKKDLEKQTTKKLDGSYLDGISVISKVFNVANFLLFSLGVVIRIHAFLQYPSRNIVEISFNTTLIPPLMIFCPVDSRLNDLRAQFAKLNNRSDLCDVKIWELLDLRGINASDIWMNPELQVRAVNESYNKRVKPSTYRVISLFDGACLDLDEGNSPTTPNYGKTVVPIQDPVCEVDEQKLYTKSPKQHLDYTRYSYIVSNIYHYIAYTIKEIVIDETRYTCVNEEEYNTCKTSCLNKKLMSNIQCRLPYMPETNKPMCESSNAAKHSHLKYLELFVCPGEAKDCNCSPPCRKRLYDILVSQVRWPWTSILFGASQNIVTTYINIPADSFVKLLCDIGGWLGSTLGLCILSTCQIILTATVKKRESV